MTYRIMTWLVALAWSSHLLGQTLPRHEIAADLSPVLINFAPTYELMYRYHGDRQTWRGRVAFFGDFSQNQSFVVQPFGQSNSLASGLEQGFTSITLQGGWQRHRYFDPILLYAGLDMALGWQRQTTETDGSISLANGEQLHRFTQRQFTGYTVGILPLLGASYRIGGHLGIGVEVNLPLYATFTQSILEQWRTQRDSQGAVILDDRQTLDGRSISYTLGGALPEQSMLSVWASVYLPSQAQQ